MNGRRFVINRDQGAKEMMTWGEFKDKVDESVPTGAKVAYIDVEGFELPKVQTETRSDGAIVIKLDK